MHQRGEDHDLVILDQRKTELELRRMWKPLVIYDTCVRSR